MSQTIPIKDLKNTSEISNLCHKSNESIYITPNREEDMGIMSIKIYENTMKQLNLYRELGLSELQIKEKKTKDARVSLTSMKEKYEL